MPLFEDGAMVKAEEMDQVRARLGTHAWMQTRMETALADESWKTTVDRIEEQPLKAKKTDDESEEEDEEDEDEDEEESDREDEEDGQ
jgi:hypothetical protein